VAVTIVSGKVSTRSTGTHTPPVSALMPSRRASDAFYERGEQEQHKNEGG